MSYTFKRSFGMYSALFMSTIINCNIWEMFRPVRSSSSFFIISFSTDLVIPLHQANQGSAVCKLNIGFQTFKETE